MVRRRLALGALTVLLLAGPAAGTPPTERKADVDARLARVREKLAALAEKESALEREIAAVTTKIRVLERDVGRVEARLAPLERDLELHQARLARLTALFELQTQRLGFLRDQYRHALASLNRRVVDLYRSGQVDALGVLVSARSLSQLLDELELLRLVARQDKRIADEVRQARDDARRTRLRTKRTRAGVAAQVRVIAARAQHVRDVRDELLAREYELAGEREREREHLAELAEQRREWIEEAEALEKASAELAAKIRSVQSTAPSAPAPSLESSAGGLIWPVSAPVTSNFGWRWGRMHEGIDLGAGMGTPIYAATAGTVIHAGWLGGYGNLVVLDHGGGVSTAYGHQSSIAVSVGQRVSQGQVIGYVGSTGHSTGPHLHFEVRVNGGAVDPLGYL